MQTRKKSMGLAVLATARCEAGTQVVAREPVALENLVQAAWQPFEARANAKDLRVRLELPELDPIEADPTLLGVVVANWLDRVAETNGAWRCLFPVVILRQLELSCTSTRTRCANRSQGAMRIR
jgi:hypothetical protein